MTQQEVRPARLEASRPVTSGRAAALGAGAAVGCAALALVCLRWSGRSLAALEGEAVWELRGAVDDLTGLVAAVVAAGLALWLSVLLLAGAVAVAPGPRLAGARRAVRSRWRTPARVAALLLALAGCGVLPAAAQGGSGGMAGSTGDPPVCSTAASPAEDPATVSAPAQVQRQGDPVPEPGWRPTTAAVPPQEADLVTRGSAPDVGVVVRAGDTLWDIAARHLGPLASDEEIAREWPRWYATNRDLIGPDPDLILPGQHLSTPAGAAEAGR